MRNYNNDKRIVLSLDAGGQSFKFCAIRANELIGSSFKISSENKGLEESLKDIITGFSTIKKDLHEIPDAISFAFPGPSDYPNGIIGDLKNLPAFRGGVALKALLEEEFQIPVFLNNDGDLFAYGEAIAGFLPKINEKLKKTGSIRQYKNLFGVTIGTGFGGGIVSDGNLFLGDNSAGAEIWIMRNNKYSHSFAEESISTRAIQRVYKGYAQTDVSNEIKPEEIYNIAIGKKEGDKEAARKAFEEMGEALGDVLANAITLVDGLIVIGGGLSKAFELFIPALMKELNGKIQTLSGNYYDRLEMKAFNLENEMELEAFCKGEQREIKVPFSDKYIQYDPLKRIGIGIATMDTEKAVAIGAYQFALNELDKGVRQ